MNELRYLHFNIFGLALSELATSSGSFSIRLSKAYRNHLFKLSWDKDFLIIPEELKDDFSRLKIILEDEVCREVLSKRNYYELNKLDEESINQLANSYTVIKNFHYKKAEKAIKLISNIYFGLGLNLQNRGSVLGSMVR